MTAHIEPAPTDIPADSVTIDRTWVFMPLFAPFGISAGYVTVTLAFQLGHAGVPAIAVTSIIAATLWAQTVKMLWAPVIDTTGNPRLWYILGAILTGASILVMTFSPPTTKAVPWLTVMAVFGSVASTLVSMSTEILMTHGVRPSKRGSASGWSQAGNVGGGGLGGGLGLFVASHAAQPWLPGLVLALICVGCSAALFLAPHIVPRPDGLSYLRRLRQVAIDVWSVARSRLGYLALILMLLPIASGAAPWAAIAADWHADADLVSLYTGTYAGLAAVVGALIAGYICDRMAPKTSYCLFGIVMGIVTALMALAPHTPMVFGIGSLAYNAVMGCGFTAYSAIVLEAIGKKSAATNFNIMSAISNMPLAVMVSFDGWMHDRHGVNAMLYGELWLPATTIAAFALFVAVTRPRGVAAFP